MKTLNDLEEVLIDKLNSLKEKENLIVLEKEMLNDEECRRLIDIFQSAQTDYNFYLKSFGEKHEFTLKAQKVLYEAKLKMDTHPLVMKYNETLKAINEPRLYLEFNLISLFSRRNKHSC